ncbi:hypothetical protein JOD57_000334 [Geodermatophilus bullaregiensis]|nr:hypothetical protein [Geodermatophilus bullaregiensis]
MFDHAVLLGRRNEVVLRLLLDTTGARRTLSVWAPEVNSPRNRRSAEGQRRCDPVAIRVQLGGGWKVRGMTGPSTSAATTVVSAGGCV